MNTLIPSEAFSDVTLQVTTSGMAVTIRLWAEFHPCNEHHPCSDMAHTVDMLIQRSRPLSQCGYTLLYDMIQKTYEGDRKTYAP